MDRQSCSCCFHLRRITTRGPTCPFQANPIPGDVRRTLEVIARRPGDVSAPHTQDCGGLGCDVSWTAFMRLPNRIHLVLIATTFSVLAPSVPVLADEADPCGAAADMTGA